MAIMQERQQKTVLERECIVLYTDRLQDILNESNKMPPQASSSPLSDPVWLGCISDNVYFMGSNIHRLGVWLLFEDGFCHQQKNFSSFYHLDNG